LGNFDWMHQFSLDSSLTLFFDFVVYMHIAHQQGYATIVTNLAIIFHYWVLFHLPFLWCSCVCCDSCCRKSSYRDITQETHVFLCFYGFDGVVELHKRTQQWNNDGDKVIGDNRANKIFKGMMAKGRLVCAMTSMRWIFLHIV